jgi:hypothetical protein
MTDEEFPAEVKVHFDPTVADHLPLDVIFGLVIEMSRRLTEGRSHHPRAPSG